MGVADHVLESISGHLSRRMLEHYSHIRIDAKRQALDALDAARRSTAHNGDGNGDGANQTEIAAIVEVADDLTSQSRHSLLLSGSPPSGKLLIPLERRDVRVVEGARLESVCRRNSTEGSNPSLSASSQAIKYKGFISFTSFYREWPFAIGAFCWRCCTKSGGFWPLHCTESHWMRQLETSTAIGSATLTGSTNASSGTAMSASPNPSADRRSVAPKNTTTTTPGAPWFDRCARPTNRPLPGRWRLGDSGAPRGGSRCRRAG